MGEAGVVTVKLLGLDSIEEQRRDAEKMAASRLL
jgi:hypothetical protein